MPECSGDFADGCEELVHGLPGGAVAKAEPDGALFFFGADAHAVKDGAGLLAGRACAAGGYIVAFGAERAFHYLSGDAGECRLHDPW